MTRRKPSAPSPRRLLPMQLQLGDRIVDESGEWEVIGRPATSGGGKTVQIRVRRVENTADVTVRLWSAHERIAVVRKG